MDHDNSNSLHGTMGDPYYLYGSQMIEAMKKKPGKMSAMMIIVYCMFAFIYKQSIYF